MARRALPDLTDEAGEHWAAQAAERWAQAETLAEQANDENQPPFVFYEAPPLPDFNEGKPEHVTRELMGRFLENRDSGTVHDTQNAQVQCRVDDIKRGTFYHVLTELPDDLEPCGICLPG